METSLILVGGYGSSIETFLLNIDLDNIEKTTLVHENSVTCDSNPSFIDVADNHVYAVHEVSSYMGEESGGLTYFKLKDGKLVKIISNYSSGLDPCHISVNPSLKCAYIANYSSGHFVVIKLKDWRPCGSLYIENYDEGSGVNKERQEASHPHSAFNNGKYIYVVDLGGDKIWHYQHDDANTNMISESETTFTQTPPGSGPRHLAFTGQLAFLITELSNELIVYQVNKENGSLKHLSAYKFLENEYEGKNYGAGIIAHPNGRFVYISNRVNGCIIVYEIKDSENGILEKIQCFPLEGTWPRHFNIHKSGRILLCADQFKEHIEVLSIDGNTGLLNRIQIVACSNKPSCVAFAS